MPDNLLLEVHDLKKHFPVRKGLFRREVGQVKAVDGVDLFLRPGKTLGLVGESGCGKTTVGRSILRLIEPTDGRILFHQPAVDGKPGKVIDVSAASDEAMKGLRRQMQIIYQDPYSSLNARMTVGSIIGEPLLVNGVGDPEQRNAMVTELMAAVGLNPDHVRRYPHQFSGGQRQRIAIARALTLNPSLIVADEPVSALDVSVQAQVLKLLKDLQKRFDLTYLFITHDLAVVKYISQRVAVMYLGRIVEVADAADIFHRPLHPYTEALISAVPVPIPGFRMNRMLLKGDVPSPVDPPNGCHFHPRCRYAKDICKKETPQLMISGDKRKVRCHLAEELELQGIPRG